MGIDLKPYEVAIKGISEKRNHCIYVVDFLWEKVTSFDIRLESINYHYYRSPHQKAKVFTQKYAVLEIDERQVVGKISGPAVMFEISPGLDSGGYIHATIP